MNKRSFFKRVLVTALAMILGIAPCITHIGTIEVQAKASTGSGSYAVGGYNNWGEVVGQWSYYDGKKDVYQSNASLLGKLPYEGTIYRHTTDNYDTHNGAFDTSNWATSFMWDLTNSNPYSMTVYAIPLAFRAGLEGGADNVIQVTAPSSLSDTANNTYTMQMPANGSLTDFAIQPSFDTSDAKVDAITDWTYDVVLENASNSSQYLKTTMVQGSIFAYFQLVGDTSLNILRPRSLPAAVAYQNGNMLVIRCMDNMDEDYDYYAFYGAEGTTFNVVTSGNMINSIGVSFASTAKAYLSMAYLGSSPTAPNDAWGTNMAQAYLPYAYNFVTDTRATYEYNATNSTLSTTYTYTVDKKAESTADGTIMGVLPHQYKNIASGTNFLDYTYSTIRGTMKTIAGNSFSTNLKYSGILPFMPDYTDDETAAGQTENAAMKEYLQEFENGFSGDYFANYEGSGDTYWDGKGLNRLGNAMVAAETAGDTEKAEKMYTSLKNHLINWFTYGGEGDDRYFFYDEDLGALFGFPQSYSAVDQVNDHHFHYGYFIYAAAQVAMRDETGEFAAQYGGMVEELIGDIACTTRNSASSRYPYLRNFAPYEGHSWASGHANFEMGNNQESSSEALNAWAGIILWGEATGNTSIRDLGIYLYATEISAVQNYWYDVEENVLSDAYRYKVHIRDIDTIDKTTAKVQNNSAAIVWGGSYTYATWFSANPLYIQGINLLPMNPTCFYLAGDGDYIQENWDLAFEKASATGWDLESWIDIWCQYYAMAFPEEALQTWKNVEEGADSYGVEGGDTKAHTYHFIQTMNTYGTPDTSVTSDTTLSSVFVKDGVKTYCAYNPTASEKKVTFSDGYSLTVAARSMGVETEGQSENQAQYTIEHYLEGVDGSYAVNEELTEKKYGEKNAEVTVTEETATEIEGYDFDKYNEENETEITVAADGSSVIKLYYNREEYQITYELSGGTNATDNPATYKYKDNITLLEPTKAGYKFTGWYTSPAMSTEITKISDTDMGDLTLYAGWQDPYEYQLDATKTISYADGKVKVSVTGVDSDGTVLIHAGFYANQSDAENITTDTGVAGLGGYTLSYNEENSTWEYTFSTGFSEGQYMVFKVNVIRNGVGDLSAWGLYEIPSEDDLNAITYYENTYLENLDGTYTLSSTVKKKAADGSNVEFALSVPTGFAYDESQDNVTSATIASGTTATLKRYYKRLSYDITYHLNDGTNNANNPKTYKYGSTISLASPTKAENVFVGWYSDEACTSEFGGIKAHTTGNIEVWAKWVTYSETPAAYTVKHFKQDAAGSNSYTLHTTENLMGIVGRMVYAVPLTTLTGYTENENHTSRRASGVVLEDGSLELSLYYDLSSTEGGGYETPSNGGYTYADGKATFYYAQEGVTSGILFMAVYDDEKTAQAKADAGNAASDEGLGAITGHGGYNLSSNNGRLEYTHAIAEGKYFVYGFKPSVGLVERWYVGSALTTSDDDDATITTYTVNHYKQAEEGSATYNLADTETISAKVGLIVAAKEKTYLGYKQNTTHGDRLASGTVLENGRLTLSLYYDVVSESSFAGPTNGGYSYADGKTTFYCTQDGVTTGIVYVAVYDSLSAAEAAVATANAAANAGDAFAAIEGEGGYPMTENNGRVEYTLAITAGKYFVYALNPNNQGVEDWYVGYAAAENSGGEQIQNASYVVRHYKQNAVDSAEYTEAETENLEGTVGSTARATVKSYDGYTLYTGHANYKPSGIITSTGDLELRLYYNLDGNSEGGGGDIEMPEDGGYTYEDGMVTIWTTKESATTVYIVTYDNKDAAQAKAEAVNAYIAANGGDGFGQIAEAKPGYSLSPADGDGRKSYSLTMESGKGFIYCFAPNPNRWYAGATEESGPAGGGEEKTSSYTITHYIQNTTKDGYEVKETEQGTGTVGDTITATPKTYTGFTHDATVEGTALSGKLVEGETLALAVYYTRDSYDITYNNMDGATNHAGNPAKYVYGVGHTLQNPSKDGFTFGGWYADAELQNPITAITADATGPVNLYAKWISNDNSVEYTVKYYKQNIDLTTYTETVVTLSGEDGATVNATIDTFTGFTHDDTVEGTVLTGILDKDGTPVVLCVYYKRNVYDITYNNMDGAANHADNPATFIYGVSTTLQSPTKENFTFGGWYADENLTQLVPTISAERAEAVILYAKWTEIVPETVNYAVKYYLETLSEGKYAEILEDRVTGSDLQGTTITAEEKAYTGYVLNEEVAGTLKSGVLSADGDLTLKLYYDREEYNITYNNMEGAINPQTNAETYVFGKGFTLSNATKNDAVFLGWYSDEACSDENQVTMITDSQTGDVVLYAKWKAEPAEYSVKYYMQNTTQDGYTEATQEAFNKTSSVGTVVNAKTEEYDKTFEGFTINESKSALEGKVSNDNPLVLKLYYDRNTYNISYENMDGATNAGGNADSYVYGVGLTLEEAEKEDAVFLGWYTDDEFDEETKLAAISTSMSGDVILYAKWMAEATVSEYTVEYYFQDTEKKAYVEDTTVRYTGRGENGSVVKAPEKEFTGFELNKNVKGTLASAELVEGESLVLKLYYDRMSYSVKYNNMGGATNHVNNAPTYVYGVGLTLNNPEREGYIFDGWYTDANFSAENKITEISTTQTGIVNVYAKWKEYEPEVEGGDDEIDDGFTVDTIAPQYFTGAKIVPEIIVKDGNKILTVKKDYTLSFKNNTNVGTAKVTITGKGNYGGKVEKEFAILPANISDAAFNVDDIYVQYKNGSALKVTPKLTRGKTTLKLGKDYIIEGDTSYSAVGNYTVKLTGIGNYGDSTELQFVVTDQVLMSKVKINSIAKQYYNNGKAIEPEIIVSYKGEVLTKGHDYDVDFFDNKSAGTATVVISGTENGKYVGTKKATFKIIGTELKKMPIELEDTEFEYTGSSILPKYYTGDLVAGKDYTVSYSKNVNTGKGTVTFTGIGAYSGTVSKTFKITAYNIANNTLDLFEDRTGDIEVEYLKGGNKPTLSLYFNNKQLVEGTDYTLSYKNNTKVGEATITIKGKGKFTGTLTKKFNIVANDMDNIVVMPEDIVAKSGQKASYYIAKLNVTDIDGKKLSAGKDYDKNRIVYKYTVNGVETEFNKNSTIGDLPEGTVLSVTIHGINGYEDAVRTQEYRVVKSAIKSAKVTIPPQGYTGEEVTLDDAIASGKVTVDIKGTPVTFEIVEGSYINNVKKGTAKVTIHGTGDFGGYKTVSFKIEQKSLSEVIAGIF